MPKTFDQLMRSADPVMAIVTTVAGDERSGCLVGFHSQCSIDPPRYVVWISEANHTFGVAERAETFAVHLVPTERRDLAARFGGQTGDDVDKLAACDWEPGPDGVPLLDGCPTRFVGRKVASLDAGGDHLGFVLEPLDADTGAAATFLHLGDVIDLDPGHEADE